jgi:ppGpp synthetase/RelA/SpoT-type nucleotidyltranferase
MSANKKTNNFNALSDPELESRLWATLEKEMEQQAKKNIPQVFRNELCVKPNQFIHKYPDGKMFLIEQDQTDSSITILLQL